MNIEKQEGKIFNLKPEMTLAMKIAATFSITYYGLLLLFEIVTVVFRRYYFDSYYFNEGEMSLGSREFVVQLIQLALSLVLVVSLIQVFRKKVHGKAVFVGTSILLIIFQLFTTGLTPWMKYALEALMVLIIAPIRVKKKLTLKDGKLQMETVEETPSEVSEQNQKAEEKASPVNEASSQPS